MKASLIRAMLFLLPYSTYVDKSASALMFWYLLMFVVR